MIFERRSNFRRNFSDDIVHRTKFAIDSSRSTSFEPRLFFLNPDHERNSRRRESCFRTFLRAFVFVCVSSVCFSVSAATDFAPDADISLLRGLASRGMFESAEHFCSQTFAKSDLPEEKRYRLAAEWVRCRTRQMLLEEPARREAIRLDLDRLEREFLGVPDDHARPEHSIDRLTLELQSAISTYSLGDWQRLESRVATESEKPDLLRQARRTLSDAIERFKICSEKLESLRQAIGRNADSSLESKMLAQLRAVRFQWGLTQMSLALTYEPGEDRTLGLERASEIFDELRSLRFADPVVLQSRIETATCSRLLGDLDRCRELLTGLDQSRLTTELRFRAETELIRYHIAVGEIDEALRKFAKGRPDSAIDPEYDLARLELFLVQIHRMRENVDKAPNDALHGEIETALKHLVELVQSVETRFGSYWGRRARMILSSSNPVVPDENRANSIDSRLIGMLAKDQYQSGRFAEAVRLFDRASRISESIGDMDDSYQNARLSIAVLDAVYTRLENSPHVSEDERFQCQKHLIDALRNVSKRFSKQDASSELHLKCIDLSGQAVLENRMTLDDYIELLKEHVVAWPDSVKVPPLLLQTGRLLLRQGAERESLVVLASVSNRSAAGLEAVETARRGFHSLPDVDALEAARWFESRLPDDENAAWNEADAISAQNAAEFLIRFHFSVQDDSKEKSSEIDALGRAETLLKKIRTKCDGLSPTTEIQVQALLITALTEQGRREEGAEELRTMNEEQIGKLTPEERRNFQRVRAGLLADSGQIQDAVDLLSELLKHDSKDLASWKILAEILSRQEDAESLKKALQVWTKIEKDSPKESDSWWTAREKMIAILLKQGKIDDAKKSFALLLSLYPDSGGEARKKRIEKMLDDVLE